MAAGAQQVEQVVQRLHRQLLSSKRLTRSVIANQHTTFSGHIAGPTTAKPSGTQPGRLRSDHHAEENNFAKNISTPMTVMRYLANAA